MVDIGIDDSLDFNKKGKLLLIFGGPLVVWVVSNRHQPVAHTFDGNALSHPMSSIFLDFVNTA